VHDDSPPPCGLGASGGSGARSAPRRILLLLLQPPPPLPLALCSPGPQPPPLPAPTPERSCLSRVLTTAGDSKPSRPLLPAALSLSLSSGRALPTPRTRHSFCPPRRPRFKPPRRLALPTPLPPLPFQATGPLPRDEAPNPNTNTKPMTPPSGPVRACSCSYVPGRLI
jgi:hypothetical protein